MDLQIGAKVGEGNYSVVLACWSRKTGIKFCLKVGQFFGCVHKAKLLREMALQQMAAHPAVVKFIQSYSDSSRVYHLMEFMQGGDLYEYLCAKHCIPENDVRNYTAQLVLAIGHLHDLKIMHRDIKLENIFISEDRKYIKLGDFGLSAEVSENFVPPQSLSGTPEYMAPEVILEGAYGLMIDWWSLGVCVYEMLTGYLPFGILDDDNKHQTFCKIIAGRLEFPGHLDYQACDLISRLLRPDPNQRLGKNGVDDLKNHKWFEGFDWDTVFASQPSSFTPLESPSSPSSSPSDCLSV